MKKLLLLTIALLFFSVSFSQEYEKDIEFPSDHHFINFFQHYDNSFVVCVQKNTYPSLSYLRKIDANGNVLWDKYMRFEGFSSLTYTPEMASTCPDGGLVLLTTIMDGTSLHNAKSFMFKLDANMELVWGLDLSNAYQRFGSTPHWLDTDAEGNIYFSVYGSAWGVYNQQIQNEYETFQKYGKVSPDGKLLWFNKFLVPNYDEHHKNCRVITNLFDYHPRLTENGELITGGIGAYYEGENFIPLPHWYKIDKDGNLVWNTYWDKEPIYNNNYNISLNKDPIKALGASVLLNNGNIVTKTLNKINSFGLNEDFLVINDKGICKFSKEIGVEGFNSLYSLLEYGTCSSITQADNNSIIMFLYTKDNQHYINKIILAKYDENLQVSKTLVKDNNDKGNYKLNDENPIQLLKTNDGNYASFKRYDYIDGSTLVGSLASYTLLNSNLEILPLDNTTNHYDYLATKPINSTDTLVIPRNKFLNPFGTTNKTEINEIAVYPNPANSVIKVEFPTYSVVKENSHNLQFEQTKLLKGEITLQIVDNAGKTVFSNNYMAESKSANIDISALNSGVYYLQLIKDNKVVGFGKVVKK
ncbi:MAG: T9SS type A sorting domain-containing protein [Bacteroidales bacterium]|jgi:hypothetical protein